PGGLAFCIHGEKQRLSGGRGTRAFDDGAGRESGSDPGGLKTAGDGELAYAAEVAQYPGRTQTRAITWSLCKRIKPPPPFMPPGAVACPYWHWPCFWPCKRQPICRQPRGPR